MKTAKGSTHIELNPFQETISLIYNLNPIKDRKKLDSIERESTILYYLSDIQYVICKRNTEEGLGKSLTDEEFNTILSKGKFPYTRTYFDVLSEEDKKRILRDANFLNQYNELYDELACNSEILQILLCIYAGNLEPLVTSPTYLENVKKHQILVKLGIDQHLKRESKRLEDRLTQKRLAKQKDDNSIVKLMSTAITKSHAK